MADVLQVAVVCGDTDLADVVCAVLVEAADTRVVASVQTVAAARALAAPDLYVAQWRLADGCAAEILDAARSTPLVVIVEHLDQVAELGPRTAGVDEWLLAEPRFLSLLPACVQRCRVGAKPGPAPGPAAASAELLALLDAIPDTLVHMSPQFEVLWVNRGAARGVGARVEELLGRRCYEIWHRRDRVCEGCPVQQSLASGEPCQVVLPAPDGRVWELRAAPIFDEAGRLVSAVEVARDVSEQQRFAADREELIRALEKKNEEVEYFAHTVSHDLKTPLTTIRGFLSLMQRDLETDAREQVAATVCSIGRTAERMQRQLDELQELYQVGRGQWCVQSVDMTALAREAVAVAAGVLRQHGVEVRIAQDLPPAWGDRMRLRQVLQNLVANAACYAGGAARPRVEVGARRQGEQAVYWVRDNGVGIADADQERVFQLFEKVDAGSSGTGFGLAIVKRIVERHGGRVWVESAGEGSGSTFCFTVVSGVGGSGDQT